MEGREGADLLCVPFLRDAAAARRWLILGGLAGSAIFIAVAMAMVAGATDAPDKAILALLRRPGGDPVGGALGLWLAIAVTNLGGTVALTLASMAGGAWLLSRRQVALTVYLAATMIVGTVLRYGLKAGFARSRPDSELHRVAVDTFSFPSSHAMMSTVTYLTLAGLALRFAPARLRTPILVLAAGLPMLIGVTRVYLGVHWPSDVLAGWSAGVAWAAICMLVFEICRVGTNFNRNGV